MPQRKNVELACVQCGATFFTTKQQAYQRGARFCSHLCAARGTAPQRMRLGKANPSYNGGLSQRKGDGRWEIICRDGSRYLYARAVMQAEIAGSITLTEDEIVHHVNGDPSDDRIENLEVMSQSEHSRLHNAMRRAARAAA
jgi:hypothetical protein